MRKTCHCRLEAKLPEPLCKIFNIRLDMQRTPSAGSNAKEASQHKSGLVHAVEDW